LVVGPHRQTDARVEAHIFVAALAFFLHRAIEKKLKAAGLDLSLDRSAAGPAHRPRRRLRARRRPGQTLGHPGLQPRSPGPLGLGITDLDPPALPTKAATVV